MNRNQVVDMFSAPFMEALRKGTADDAKNDDNDCIFETENSYSEWGLLTPPWSPCDANAMDTCTDCDSLTVTESAVAAPTTRARSDSFLCSCTSCDCSGLERVDGPVLRDCMWSQTTGLLQPPSLIARQTSDACPDTADQKPVDVCRPCCPAITAACRDHTDRCVDPKNVFPCEPGSSKSHCAPSQPAVQRVVSPDSSVTKSPVYDPDSETSAYCSSFSGLLFTIVCKFRKPYIHDDDGACSMYNCSLHTVQNQLLTFSTRCQHHKPSSPYLRQLQLMKF